MRTIRIIATSAAFVTFASACVGSTVSSSAPEQDSAARPGPAATSPTPQGLPTSSTTPGLSKPPDVLLDALAPLAAARGLSYGQQARIIFGCARLKRYYCRVRAGVLGPKMTQRVVKAHTCSLRVIC